MKYETHVSVSDENAHRYDIWVDFTQIYHGRSQSLTKFAKNPCGIRKGERVRVGDHEGKRAMADVVDVLWNTVVILDIDATTYYTL